MTEAASGSDREDRIREIAYFIWLEEGCPNGRDQDHWQRARARVELMEAAPSPMLAVKPPLKSAKSKAAPTRKTPGKR